MNRDVYKVISERLETPAQRSKAWIAQIERTRYRLTMWAICCFVCAAVSLLDCPPAATPTAQRQLASKATKASGRFCGAEYRDLNSTAIAALMTSFQLGWSVSLSVLLHVWPYFVRSE